MATRASTTIRPPELDLIDDCVHCGFCLPTCPTYTLWGEEMDSPRGRIVLMKEGLREGASCRTPMVTHFDRCLGCMACVTACPSGVQYDKLIEDTRAQIERNHRAPAGERLYAARDLRALPAPGPAARAGAVARAGPALGCRGSRAPARRCRPPAAARAARAGARAVVRDAAARLPELTPARGEQRGTRRLPPGLRPARLLPRRQRRDGAGAGRGGLRGVRAARAALLRRAPAPHRRGRRRRRRSRKETIEAFEGCDHVVVNAAGCGSAMKDYGHLLREDPEWAERAEAFSAGCAT